MSTPQTTNEHNYTPPAPIVRPYAKRGTKTAAREAARKAGQKTFLFTCNTHGLTVFGTAGGGHCRECTAARKRAAYERQKRAEMATALTPEERETIAKCEAFIADILRDGGAA